MSEAPAGGGRIAARYVAAAPDAPMRPAELVWDRSGRLVRVGRPRGPVADVCVVPGFCNAHAHLQLGPLAARPRSFRLWLSAVMAERQAEAPAARRERLDAAVALLLADGTTAVGEVDSTGDSWLRLRRGPLRGRCYRELTGFHIAAVAATRLARSRLRRAARAQFALAAGLSPHAPYSVSAPLFAAAARSCRHLMVHCAEVPEEQQFLRSGRGPFADLLAELGRLPAGFRAPGVGAVAWLAHLGVLRRHTALVHCQELERGDVARIAGSGASIVVCPGTIEWFRRSPPPVDRWLAAGIPVALGTDSLASNHTLSMRAELARAARWWPGLSPRRLLHLATA
ncbi:MAG: amidohydrolase family protein, partial [Planctomycetota bacterium]